MLVLSGRKSNACNSSEKPLIGISVAGTELMGDINCYNGAISMARNWEPSSAFSGEKERKTVERHSDVDPRKVDVLIVILVSGRN